VPGALVVTDLSTSFIDDDATSVTSDTGEIMRDWKRGLMTIDTTRSAAAIGWLRGKPVVLKSATISTDNAAACVMLSSLDGQSLETSKRILVTAVARVHAVKANWRSSYLSEPVTGTVVLKSGLSQARLRPISPVGTPGPGRAVVSDQGRLTLSLQKDDRTHWWILEAEDAAERSGTSDAAGAKGAAGAATSAGAPGATPAVTPTR